VKPLFELDPSKLPPTDKALVIKMLEESFDSVISVLPGITPEQLKRAGHRHGRDTTIPTGGR
jgi:hypothetical protein